MIKTFLALVVAGAFLTSVPVHAEEKAAAPAGEKAEKPKKPSKEKKDEAKAEGKKEEKAAGGW